jgi:trypsin
VSKITVHPDYDASVVDNDVAVWKLSSPIQSGSNIAYATLPSSGSDPEAGSTVTVAGW